MPKRLYVDTFKGRRYLNFLPCDVLSVGELREYTFNPIFLAKRLVKFYLKFLKAIREYDEIIINNRVGRFLFWLYPVIFLRKLIAGKPKVTIDYLDDAWRQRMHIIKYVRSIKSKILNFILGITAALGDILNFFIGDKFVTVNKKMKHFLEKFSKKIEIIPNELPKNFAEINEKNVRVSVKEIIRDKKFLFMPTSIRENIDWDFVYEITKCLQDYGIYFVLAGEGPLKENILKRFSKLSNFIYLGYINMDEVKYTMKNCIAILAIYHPDLVVLGDEMSVMKIQEALTFGKPVITNWLEARDKKVYMIKNPKEIIRILQRF